MKINKFKVIESIISRLCEASFRYLTDEEKRLYDTVPLPDGTPSMIYCR